jgi:hypothetical protein
MKNLKNILFVDSTDSIIEKMVVVITTTKEIMDLKSCFTTFLLFLI